MTLSNGAPGVNGKEIVVNNNVNGSSKKKSGLNKNLKR